MYQTLYEYFITHKKLSLPGIGIFLLERRPAQEDFINKQILPPSYSITLHSPAAATHKSVYTWLSKSMQISETDAVVRFNDFSFNLKKEITAGAKIDWSGMGKLLLGLAGEIKFDPHLKNKNFEQAISVEKLIHEEYSHTVRVGEDEKTSKEMVEFLSYSHRINRKRWLIYAIAAGILAIVVIIVASRKNNPNGSREKITPDSPTETYRLLP